MGFVSQLIVSRDVNIVHGLEAKLAVFSFIVKLNFPMF